MKKMLFLLFLLMVACTGIAFANNLQSIERCGISVGLFDVLSPSPIIISQFSQTAITVRYEDPGRIFIFYPLQQNVVSERGRIITAYYRVHEDPGRNILV